MCRLVLMLFTAVAIATLVLATPDAEAQLVVTCGGAIHNCPQGKKMYCNRWKACKGKKPKVAKYCDAPVCMTERKGKD